MSSQTVTVELGRRPLFTEFPPVIENRARFAEPRGIIAHLRKVHNDFLEAGIVRATGSRPLSGSNDYGPSNALVFESGDAFISNTDPKGDNPPRGSWLCYDFRTRRVLPTHYAIRSHDDPPGREHLKSWIIEGSADGNNWELLDRQDDNSALNGLRFAQEFPLTGTTERRFIRLTNIGKSHRGDWMIQIEAWEIFGTLVE